MASANLDWVVPACGGFLVIVAAATVIGKGAKWMRRTLRKIDRFLDDFNGIPETEGRARQPGVLERLRTIENRLLRVENQVKPNGGGSLRDAVDTTIATTERIEEKVDSARQREVR